MGGGAARVIPAARSEGYEPEWRRAMAKKFFSQGGDELADYGARAATRLLRKIATLV